jgi:alpha-glucuronidase
MRAAFGPIWRYAHEMGMKVYFKTDMLPLSPPLTRYLTKHVGGLDTTDSRLWSVYQAGLHELFTTMPYVDGMMIRIGEGGSDYTYPGSNFYSRIKVTTVAQVRDMLNALLHVADSDGRDIIFRTWSVGIGGVGNLHTNPKTYHTVLHGIDDDHLIVSTKYVAGDFYSHLPLNKTLLTGGQRRIIEFQSRREYEGLGSLPDDVGRLEQRALKAFVRANPHVVGIWNWPQGGGPLHAGPRSLYLRLGFWQLWDINVYLTARLAWEPRADLAQATNDWIRQTFSTDPKTVSAIAAVMQLSRRAIGEGLYISPYADKSVRALGLRPPPMLWIFEWNIVGGDSASREAGCCAAPRVRRP